MLGVRTHSDFMLNSIELIKHVQAGSGKECRRTCMSTSSLSMFDVIYHQVNSHTKIVIYQQVYSYTKRVLYHQVCSYTKIVIYHRLYSYTKANTFRWEVGADADVPPRVLPLCLPSMMIKYPYNLLNWSRFTPKRRANHVIPASTQLRNYVPP